MKKKIKYRDIRMGKDGVYKLKEKDGETISVKIAEPIKIRNIYEDIETKEIYLELNYMYKEELKEIMITRDIFTKNNLLELQKYGVDVTEENAKDLIKHLINCEIDAEKNYTYTSLGWGSFNNNTIFKHCEFLPKQNSTALYCGEFDINPKGNKSEWIEMLNKEVIGNTELETIIAISLSSALVYVLNELIDGESIFVHLSGDSTTGKSTALMLALSVWGSCDPHTKSLFLNWNATSNALMRMMKNNNGILVGIDESSVSTIEDFSKIIYQLANGKERIRMNKELKMDESGAWKTTIISTGENSLKGSSNQNKGISVRILEFNNIQWTKSAENAERIKNCVLNHYGHIWEDFVNKIIELGEIPIREMFKEVLNKLNENLVKNRLSKRLIKKIAAIVLAGEIANMTFDFKLNIEKITEFFNDNVLLNNDIDEDIDVIALEYVKEYISKNARKFYKTNVTMEDWGYLSHEIVGRIEQCKGGYEVYIPTNKMKEILQEGKFTNHKLIIDKWNNKGLLKTDKGRTTTKKRISNLAPTSVRCYCLLINEGFDYKQMYENIQKARYQCNEPEKVEDEI